MTRAPLVFELDRLISYDNAAILDEVRRAAALLPDGPISIHAFERIARVSPSVCRRRFGGWKETLEAAGLGDRYGGTVVSQKMRQQRGQLLSADEVVAELKRLAQELGVNTLIEAEAVKRSPLLGGRVARSRFGSWQAALTAAGLEVNPHARRWTLADYFENMLVVWTHYGRWPRLAEMDRPPSRITAGGYEAKFGSWGKAKFAFVERMNADLVGAPEERLAESNEPTRLVPVRQPDAGEVRQVPLGLRYSVLRRDRFRCVGCGRSPATDLACVLHVDHVVPVAHGGLSVLDNLRSLCEDCNLGKGDRPA